MGIDMAPSCWSEDLRSESDYCCACQLRCTNIRAYGLTGSTIGIDIAPARWPEDLEPEKDVHYAYSLQCRYSHVCGLDDGD